MAQDEKLVAYAKIAIGAEHGLDETASRRLAGNTVDELHADARAMARELGVTDPSQRERGDDGRYATSGERFNALVRRASGRVA